MFTLGSGTCIPLIIIPNNHKLQFRTTGSSPCYFKALLSIISLDETLSSGEFTILNWPQHVMWDLWNNLYPLWEDAGKSKEMHTERDNESNVCRQTDWEQHRHRLRVTHTHCSSQQRQREGHLSGSHWSKSVKCVNYISECISVSG